jgi:integrase
MRWGELFALRLSDIDPEGATVRVERSLEETKNGPRFKPPKQTEQAQYLAPAQRPYCASTAGA